MNDGATDPAPTPRRRRRRVRRGRRALIATIAAGALWLAGYGVGWFGEGERGSDRDAESAGALGQASSMSSERLPPRVEGQGDSPLARDVAHDPKEAAPPRPAPELATPPLAVVNKASQGDARPAPTTLIDRDQLESVLSIVQRHVRQQDFGAAASVLARLRPRVAGYPDGVRRVREWSDRVRAAADDSEQTVLELIRSGEVLAACQLCSRLVRDGGWRPRRALSAYRELGSDWSALVSRDSLPSAAPLPRRRWVRLPWVGGWREGVVAGARGDLTTVRLQAGGRQQFPTLSTASLEPVDATAAEAVEMAVWAAKADAALLARLWMVRAMTSGADLGDRGERMLRLLGGR